jgi:hypothetical protein
MSSPNSGTKGKPSCLDCLDNVGSLISRNRIGLHGLLRGLVYFFNDETFLRTIIVEFLRSHTLLVVIV